MPTNARRGAALYYATHDGQARRIAEHIARRLAESGVITAPLNAAEPTAPAELAAASVIVLVAAVRYGKHLPEAQCLSAQDDRASSPGAGIGRRLCRAARLSAL